jgi:hypothetical protein
VTLNKKLEEISAEMADLREKMERAEASRYDCAQSTSPIMQVSSRARIVSR